jgi:ParB/RepB/Spo0J family partition protein
MKEIEIQEIDRRLEGLRLKNKQREAWLIASIAEKGIQTPLQGIRSSNSGLILLDGFKRLRCCCKLNINQVPVLCLGNDKTIGILKLLKDSNERALNILEQAALVDELKETSGLNIREIARQLDCSPAWVSVRLNLLGQMSQTVKEAIFAGRFPVRSYMYTLQSFTRVNKTPSTEIDVFVKLTSGKGFSQRQIETLAHGFFRGGDKLKEQMLSGQLDWTLNQLQATERQKQASNLNQHETRVLLDLELMQKYINRVNVGLVDPRLKNPAFFSQAKLLVEGILSRLKTFQNTLEEFDDQSGHS